MRPFLLATILATLSAPLAAQPKECGALPAPFEGLLFAGDGDTAYSPAIRAPIRIWGVQVAELRDAAKRETVPGMIGRAALEDLLAASGHKARCEPVKWDRYCRAVSVCTAGGKELGLELIRQGLAYGFYLAEIHPLGADKSVAYAAAEAEARRERRGLWPVWLGERRRP